MKSQYGSFYFFYQPFKEDFEDEQKRTQDDDTCWIEADESESEG